MNNLPAMTGYLDAVKNHDAMQARMKTIPTDQQLHLPFFHKLAHRLKTTFVTLPQTVRRGLKGEADYTFADGMLLSKIPYVLGGIMLPVGFLVGGDKIQFVRQAVGVGMYMLFNAATHFYINSLYAWRYGWDLRQLYRRKTGQVEPMSGSSDFPPLNLLTPQQIQRVARKTKTPQDVHELDGAVREQIRHLIPGSRALKFLVATLGSCIAAGYVARSDAWYGLDAAQHAIRKTWQGQGSWLQKLLKNSEDLSEVALSVIQERFNLTKASRWQKTLVLGYLGVLLASAAYIWFFALPRKQYAYGNDEPLARPQYPQIPQTGRIWV